MIEEQLNVRILKRVKDKAKKDAKQERLTLARFVEKRLDEPSKKEGEIE